MNRTWLILTTVILILMVHTTMFSKSWKVVSPDSQLSVTFFIKKFGDHNRLFYHIQFRNQDVVRPSQVSFILDDGELPARDFNIETSWYRSVNQESELLYGKNKIINEKYNEIGLQLTSTSAKLKQIHLIARAYSEGIAFRFEIPPQAGKEMIRLQQELLQLNLPEATVYYLPLKNFQTPYENNYQVQNLTEISPKQLIGLPILFKLSPSLWVVFTEAEIEDYPGMYLRREKGKPMSLSSCLSPLPEDSTTAARLRLPHLLPWRVFMVAENPGKLIESDIIFSLNEPSRIENPCWIQPGKVVWPWWSNRVVRGRNFEGGMNTATMKYYIDFARYIHAQYLLIDAGWYGKHDTPNEDITTTVSEIDLPEIIHYAKTNGIGVLLWLNWQCVRDQMGRAFPMYEKWGIKGIKVDYMNRDDQEMVNFYHQVVQKAVRHHLIVNFHGAYKPDGLQRTFPNLLTREGVLGLEWSKWSTRCNPDHELLLPFIRMLAGPMDFTPGAFRVSTKDAFKPEFTAPMAMGTRAHQLAMYVVYYSPLQMLVDHPSSYQGKVGVEFLQAFPTVWDETRFLEGEVGEYIVVARRSGSEWYLGAMTNWKQRSLNVPLSFLAQGTYMAHIFCDGQDPAHPEEVVYAYQEVNSGEVLEISLAPGGGCAIRFVPTWESPSNKQFNVKNEASDG